MGFNEVPCSINLLSPDLLGCCPPPVLGLVEGREGMPVPPGAFPLMLESPVEVLSPESPVHESFNLLKPFFLDINKMYRELPVAYHTTKIVIKMPNKDKDDELQGHKSRTKMASYKDKDAQRKITMNKLELLRKNNPYLLTPFYYITCIFNC